MHFQMCQDLLRSVDKDEIVDGRNKRLTWTFRRVCQVVVHGHKILNAHKIQLFLDLQFAVVSDPHRVPSDDVVTFHFEGKGNAFLSKKE